VTAFEDPTSRHTLKIREITGDSHDAAVVARLHMSLFGYGPVGQLGEGFLSRFCYTKLIREGLIRAAVFEVDGEPAGFVAYTTLAVTFHRLALRKYPLHAGGALIYSMVRSPRVVLSVLKALHLMVSRRSQQEELGSDPCAEILAFGVLPQYRDREFVRRTGIRISQRLVEHATTFFKQNGLSEARAVVDTTNRPTLLFYRMLGASLEPYVQAGISSRLVRLPLIPTEGLPVEDAGHEEQAHPD